MEPLHQHLPPPRRVGQRAGQRRGLVDHRDPDAGATGRWLDHHRKIERQRRGRAIDGVGLEDHVGDDRQARGGQQPLGADLVHRQRRGGDAAAGVRHAHRLEQSLGTAVLPERTVEHDHRGLDGGGPDPLGQIPAGVDLDHVVSAGAQRRGHGATTQERDFPLVAESSQEDRHLPPQPLHDSASTSASTTATASMIDHGKKCHYCQRNGA